MLHHVGIAGIYTLLVCCGLVRCIRIAIAIVAKGLIGHIGCIRTYKKLHQDDLNTIGEAVGVQ
jgi:hypothetical protein